MEGVWLSITDYSSYKKISISTIRRYIKSNILKYKEENGKYFIYVPSNEKIKVRQDEETLRNRLEIEFLKTQLRQLQQENAELKMLVELYEGKKSLIDLPPELPESL
jgi:uncharacterized protein involved in tellurium resistance